MTPASWSALGDLLLVHPTSSRVIINHSKKNMFTDEACEKISETLARRKSLKSLSLRGCKITPKQASLLGKAIRKNASLTELDLSYSSIEEGGIKLAKGLAVNRSIKKIKLFDCKSDSIVT